MFHPVKILKANGKTKQIIPSKSLSEQYWESFQKSENGISLVSNGRPQIPRWMKQKLDLEYPTHMDSTLSYSS
ncbi:MAG: hypothetical protein G3M78_07295 [Candidatus Nitrohelix vancouverensis]|uniref:Uncharacterized protein n=1 Tax=Candidatus Nitrohelix vancouverensis TaxID=2705534 RepID=A0A7T0C2B9_9BACT|nr:MAG: hypothetical protein G3M78_07295 [Candidatus Nitrohelix vancouverensis]